MRIFGISNPKKSMFVNSSKPIGITEYYDHRQGSLSTNRGR